MGWDGTVSDYVSVWGAVSDKFDVRDFSLPPPPPLFAPAPQAITEGLLRYKFGGAYIWRGLFSEFYGIWLTGLSDSEIAKSPELCCAPCIRRKQIFVILHHC